MGRVATDSGQFDNWHTPQLKFSDNTLVYQLIGGATQFGSLRLNPYGSPCPLV